MIRTCKGCGVPVTRETGGMMLDVHLLVDGRTEERVAFICNVCAADLRQSGAFEAGGERTVLVGDVQSEDHATFEVMSSARRSGKRRSHRRRRHH